MCVAATAQKLTNSAETIASSGDLNGQLYSNRALGFSILVPGGWNFWTSDQNAALVSQYRENAVGTGNAAIKDSAANTQVLFQAIQRESVGIMQKATFSCGVERLKAASTSEKWLGFSKDLVARTNGVKVTKDIYPLTFGGVKFLAFDVEGTANGVAYRQMHIATVRKNAALFFVVTLYDGKQDAIIEHSLRSIKFL